MIPAAAPRSSTRSRRSNKIKSDSHEEQIGIDIIRRALEEPLRQIAENAGFEGSVEVNRVKAAALGQGFDAMTGNLVDMIKAGIVEPFKVTRSALQNAASIGALVSRPRPDRRQTGTEAKWRRRTRRRHGRHGRRLRHDVIFPNGEDGITLRKRSGITPGRFSFSLQRCGESLSSAGQGIGTAAAAGDERAIRLARGRVPVSSRSISSDRAY